MPTFVMTPVSSPAAPVSTLDRVAPSTSLSLDRFFRIVNYSPILGHQVMITTDDLQPATSCSDPVLQYTWQPKGGGEPGRYEILQAISQAEQLIEDQLGFPLLPRWIANDHVVPVRATFGGGALGWCPYAMVVKVNSKHVLNGGQEGWSIVQDDAPITYTDVDGDGYKETATVSVVTTVTDPNELRVYYPDSVHNHAWEIRPLNVSISAGTATIKFSRHLAVLPQLQEELNAAGVDGMADGNFLGAVDVWRNYNDASKMATVEWVPSICDNALCQWESAEACLNPVDERTGMVNIHAGEYDAGTDTWLHTCPTWWQMPSRIRAWYRSGIEDGRAARTKRDMAPQLERAVALLAVTLMDREWQSCEMLRNLQAHWKTDFSQRISTQGQSTSYARSFGMLNNPLGHTRAADYAWTVCRSLMVGEVVLAH